MRAGSLYAAGGTAILEVVSARLSRLAGLTTECRTAEEYQAARTEWLMATVDCDALYQGAVASSRNYAPVVTGIDPRQVSACEANADRYWHERTVLTDAARRAGGVAIDIDVLGAKQREQSPFYREVMRAVGIQASAIAVLQLRGEISSAIWLGRVGRARLGAHFRSPASLRALREALPVLALGDALHLEAGRAASVTPDLGLNTKEREVMHYLMRGLTNAQIATLLGSSHAAVKNQVATLLRKVGAANRTELAGRLQHEAWRSSS